MAILPVVLISTLLAGTVAGGACLVTGLLGAWYLFMGQPYSLTLAPHEGADLIAALLRGAVTIGICSSLRHSVAALHAASARETVLVRELQHRVKNTLMVILSLSRRTYLGGAPLAEAQKDFEARIMALSEAHTSLGHPRQEGAGLRDLVERCLRPFGFDAGDTRIDVGGPEVALTAQAAVAIALALHELATNAAKYGALTSPAGRVSVRWSVTLEPALSLEWREFGGPRIGRPERSGFGSQLIERNVANELGGRAQLTFAPEGLHAELVALTGFELR